MFVTNKRALVPCCSFVHMASIGFLRTTGLTGSEKVKEWVYEGGRMICMNTACALGL